MEHCNLEVALRASRRVKCRAVWSALLASASALLVAAAPIGAASAQTANVPASSGVFFYPRKGQKYYLPSSSTWVGVQVAPGTSLTSTARSIAAGGGVGSAMALTRQNLVLVKLAGAATSQRLANLRGRAATTPSVQHVVRTFGDTKSPLVETKEFIVRFAAGTTASQAAGIVGAQNAVIVRVLGRQSPNGYLVRLKDAAGTDSISAANALNARSDVKYALPNFVSPEQVRAVATKANAPVTTRTTTFNDPLFPNQWHLRNTGQGGGTVGADAKVADAWDITTGDSSIVICINDDGVETTHPDLTAHIVAGRDVVDDDNDPNPDSESFHGTSCAGVAAAVGDNNLGVSGADPTARIMPIRLIVEGATYADEAESFKYAADHGADVISDSWGPPDGDPYTQHQAVNYPLPSNVQDGIDYAVTNGRGGKGSVVLFAGGNGNESMDADGFASYSKVIAVGATTNEDERAFYSDYGDSLDVSAPSNGGTLSITTTDRTGSVGYNSSSGTAGNYTSTFGGTSSACPLVAGIVGLMLSVNPSLTPTEVRQILEDTADKIDQTNGDYDSDGHSIYYGYGRVNAYEAVREAKKRATHIAGTVTDPDGNPLAGVTITVRSSSETGSVVATTKTDSDGNYSVNVVDDGTYVVIPSLGQLTFSPPSQFENFQGTSINDVDFTAVLNVNLVAPADNTTLQGSTTLQATTSDDADVTSVKFFYHGVDLTVTDNTVRNIPDAGSNGTAGKISPALTVSGANSGDVLGNATVAVNITHTERSDLVLTLIGPSGTRYTLYNRDTSGTGTIQSTFPVAPTNESVNGTWHLEVQDVDHTNIGKLNSWSLTLLPKRTTIGTDSNGATNGFWTLPWNTSTVTPGTYTVGATAKAGTVSSTDENTNIQIKAVMYDASGMVTLNGEALQGVKITITKDSTTVGTVMTGVDGTYSTTLAMGTYKFTPTKAGYSFNPTSRTVALTSGNKTGLDFTALSGTPTPAPSATPTKTPLPTATPIPESYNVMGSTTVDGAPLSGVQITVTKNNATVATKTTDSGGSYVVKLLAGTYTVKPSKAGYTFSPVSTKITITDSGIADVDFAATKFTGTVTGTVSFGSGKKMKGVKIKVKQNGEKVVNVTTGKDGNYTVTGLPSGTYTFTPSDDSHSFTPSSTTVTLSNSNVSNVNFTTKAKSSSGGGGRPRSSSVALQSAIVNAQSHSLRLNFSGPLDWTTGSQQETYSVTVDGNPADVLSAQASGNGVSLSVSPGTIGSGSQVDVGWSGLTDAQGLPIEDDDTTVNAR